MKSYGITRSKVKPKPVEVTENKVFIATDIKFVDIQTEEHYNKEYEFNYVEYDKDEYIELISKKNEELEQQVTDTQLALCDVYEMFS